MLKTLSTTFSYSEIHEGMRFSQCKLITQSLKACDIKRDCLDSVTLVSVMKQLTHMFNCSLTGDL